MTILFLFALNLQPEKNSHISFFQTNAIHKHILKNTNIALTDSGLTNKSITNQKPDAGPDLRNK